MKETHGERCWVALRHQRGNSLWKVGIPHEELSRTVALSVLRSLLFSFLFPRDFLVANPRPKPNSVHSLVPLTVS